MAKFKCIRGVRTSQGFAQPGDLVEGLPEHEMRVYMAQGRFVPHDETEIRTTVAETTDRDPKPAKKRGRPRKGE